MLLGVLNCRIWEGNPQTTSGKGRLPPLSGVSMGRQGRVHRVVGGGVLQYSYRSATALPPLMKAQGPQKWIFCKGLLLLSDPARRRLEFTPFHGHLAKKCSDTRRRHPSAADTERLQKAIDWYYTRWAEGGSAACPVNPGHSEIGVFLKAEVTLPLGESADPATLGGSAEVKLGPARECSLVPFSFKVGRRRSDPPPLHVGRRGVTPPPVRVAINPCLRGRTWSDCRRPPWGGQTKVPA